MGNSAPKLTKSDFSGPKSGVSCSWSRSRDLRILAVFASNIAVKDARVVLNNRVTNKENMSTTMIEL